MTNPVWMCLVVFQGEKKFAVVGPGHDEEVLMKEVREFVGEGPKLLALDVANGNVDEDLARIAGLLEKFGFTREQAEKALRAILICLASAVEFIFGKED